MSKKKKETATIVKNTSGPYLFGAVVLLLLGGIGIALAYLKPDLFPNPFLAGVSKWVGIVAAVFGVLLLLVGLGEKHKYKKAKQKQQAEYDKAVRERIEEMNAEERREEKPKRGGLFGKKEKAPAPVRSQSAETVEFQDNRMRYIPSDEVFQFQQMGDRQPTDEKFAEIAKMDQTQFVIYVARLFSRKGYQVKLTPVVDNYGIDMLVEKMGVVIAVGCILSAHVLGEKDIHWVLEGSRRYPVSQVMALTNMYFDRSALEYAKRERMSLVDRNVLVKDFMS